jgi:hypothetical protein
LLGFLSRIIFGELCHFCDLDHSRLPLLKISKEFSKMPNGEWMEECRDNIFNKRVVPVWAEPPIKIKGIY